MEPNYKSYSVQELRDVLKNIDKDSYPDRYINVLAELESRVKRIHKEDDASEKTFIKKKIRKPRTDSQRLTTCFFLTLYVVYSLYAEKIPGRNNGIELSESPFLYWVLILSFSSIIICDLVKIKSLKQLLWKDT